MKILLIGASGFIGRRLTQVLESAGMHVLKSSRKPLEGFITVDPLLETQTLHQLERLEIDAIVNLSWHTEGADYLYSRSNESALIWNKSLLRVLSRTSIPRIISLGSALELPILNSLNVDHERIESTVTPYAKAKLQAFNYFSKIFAHELERATWARIFQTYGVGQPEIKLLPMLRNYSKSGLVFSLKNPYEIRDWISVDDVTRGIHYLLVNSSPFVVDIGTGYGTSNFEICSLFHDRFGLKFEFDDRHSTNSSVLVAPIESFYVTKCSPFTTLKNYIEGMA